MPCAPGKWTCFYLSFVLTFRSFCFMLRLLMLCQPYSRHSHYSCPCFGFSFSENLKSWDLSNLFFVSKKRWYLFYMLHRGQNLCFPEPYRKMMSQARIFWGNLNDNWSKYFTDVLQYVIQVQSGSFGHLNRNVFLFHLQDFLKKNISSSKSIW